MEKSPSLSTMPQHRFMNDYKKKVMDCSMNHLHSIADSKVSNDSEGDDFTLNWGLDEIIAVLGRYRSNYLDRISLVHFSLFID